MTSPAPRGSRPRLLVMLDHFDMRGGGEVVAAQLAQRLTGRFEVAILTTDRARQGRTEAGGLPLYVVRSTYPARLRPFLGSFNPRVLPAVRHVLRDFRPQVVHAWNVHEHLSYASLLAARAAGAATVMTFQDALAFCYTKYHCYINRGAPARERPSYHARPQTCRSCWRHYWLFPPRNRLNRALIGRAVNAKVAVSHALAEALAQNGVPGTRVIHNGLPLEEVPPPTEQVEQLRARFQLGPLAILAGGRMSYFKGQQQALAAFATLADRYPEARLVLAGRRDDWFGRLLADVGREKRLEERVVFTDHLSRPDFLALLAAGAVFASLSLYLDPFPTVNLEAGACGVPVLGTCFGGTPEVVLDGQSGLIVSPWRTDEVVQGLDRLLGDGELRARLGAAARERIATEFPIQKMLRSYVELFEALT